jgi:hypothetical protein
MTAQDVTLTTTKPVFLEVKSEKSVANTVNVIQIQKPAKELKFATGRV